MSRPSSSVAAAVTQGIRSESTHTGRLHNRADRSLQKDFNHALQRSESKREHGTAGDSLTLDWPWPCGALQFIATPMLEPQETQRGIQLDTVQTMSGQGVAAETISTPAPCSGTGTVDHPSTANGHMAGHKSARRRTSTADTATIQSLFDRLVRLIDISPSHQQRLWRLTIRLNDEVLSGTQLCVEALADRTELRFTPGSASAARELAAVAELWSQRLSARAGRLVSIRVLPEMTNHPPAFFTPPLTGATP